MAFTLSFMLAIFAVSALIVAAFVGLVLWEALTALAEVAFTSSPMLASLVLSALIGLVLREALAALEEEFLGEDMVNKYLEVVGIYL